MTYAIAGLRDYEDREHFEFAMFKILHPKFDKVIVGDATGVDAMARDYYKDTPGHLRVLEADWERYGKAAGPYRTRCVVAEAAAEGGALIAFWNGETRPGHTGRGTFIAIQEAISRGMTVHLESTIPRSNESILPPEPPAASDDSSVRHDGSGDKVEFTRTPIHVTEPERHAILPQPLRVSLKDPG